MDYQNSIASSVKLRLRLSSKPYLKGADCDTEDQNGPDTEEKSPDVKKKSFSVWTQEERTLFFDALKQYGKNFPEISRYMKLKGRARNVETKTWKQVKVFYQRTWHNIKGFLVFGDDIRSVVKELYGLINYGHFRKYAKNKILTTKQGERLNELVHNGITRVKVRGRKKLFIVRSPVCPALRRLNHLEGPRVEYQFPETVLLDIVPRSGLSYSRVLSAGQNPRVRVKVSLNRQLFDPIDALRSKWRTAAMRLRESLSLPVSGLPRFTIYLPEDALLDGALSVTSVSKSKVKDIAFETYLHNQRKQLSPSASPDPDAEGNLSRFKMDLRAMANKLRLGISIDECREVRLLALYLSLGCPTVIRLEYEYLSLGDIDQRENGITNTLRRLFHLTVPEFNQSKERTALELENNQLKAKLENLQSQNAALKEQMRQLSKTGRNSKDSCAKCNSLSMNGSVSIINHNARTSGHVFQVPLQPVQSTSRLQLRQVSLLAGKNRLPAVQRQLKVGGDSVVSYSDELQRFVPVQQLSFPNAQPVIERSLFTDITASSSASLSIDVTVTSSAKSDDSLCGILSGLTDAKDSSAISCGVGSSQQQVTADDNASFDLPVTSSHNHTSHISDSHNHNQDSFFNTSSLSALCASPLPSFSSYSPLKTPQKNLNDNSRDSFTTKLDSAISAMISEETNDYIDKFAQLVNVINHDNDSTSIHNYSTKT